MRNEANIQDLPRVGWLRARNYGVLEAATHVNKRGRESSSPCSNVRVKISVRNCRKDRPRSISREVLPVHEFCLF
jgi:hypothetical protein